MAYLPLQLVVSRKFAFDQEHHAHNLVKANAIFVAHGCRVEDPADKQVTELGDGCELFVVNGYFGILDGAQEEI